MDVVSSSTYIDPSLESRNFLSSNENLNVTYGDESGLTSNTSLDYILDIDQIPYTVCRDSSDRVWSFQDQEENIRLLRRNSELEDFPFPQIEIPSAPAERGSYQPLPADSSPTLKRRRRKRKAGLSEAEQEAKRRGFLERNRLAARKCRARKNIEIEGLLEDRRVFGRENLVLKQALQELWDEVCCYKKAMMAHTSCDHPDMVGFLESNTESSAARDALCQSLLGDKQGKEHLDGRGSPRSSADSSPQDSTRNSTFWEDRWSEILSISPLTSSPPSPASTRKESSV